MNLLFKDSDGSFVDKLVPMLLPHEVLHHLYKKSPEAFKSRMFGSEGNSPADFWARARSTLPWLREHPAYGSIEASPQNYIPLRVHGDEVVYNQQGGKLLVANVASALTRTVSMSVAKILCFAIRPTCILSFDPILQVLAWSFHVLLSGIMPAVGPDGETPLTGPRSRLAGQPIAGGLKFVFMQLVGDWQFLVQTLQLNNTYSHDLFCFLCRCTKSAGPRCAWNYHHAAGWVSSMVAEASFYAEHQDLVWYEFPGFCVHMVRLDLMHLLCLGIFHWVLGACLWEMVQEGRWLPDLRGNWKYRHGMQLQSATHEFRQWARSRKISHKQLAFSIGSLSMSSLQSRPYLKGKAHNLNVVAQWLGDVAAEVARGAPDDVHKAARANCLWGYNSSLNLLRDAPVFLPDETAADLELCRGAALYSHGALSWAAGQCGTGTWLTKPKNHMYDHCMRLAQVERLNPIFWWCFADESFVGLVSVIAKRVHCGASLEGMLLERWIIRWDAECRQT